MQNLAQFKKRLQVGTKLETIHACLGNLGVREISIVQSNSFALATNKPEGIVNSWCEYPKVKDFEIIDENTAAIYWGEGEKREKILTYKFI